MRKLTGYIGAMIIVFALMGSILAGYALNINGTNTVINEYEKVTDVSGLYSHTQEPTYIDYNPASNYIGYETEKVTYSPTSGNYRYKSMGSNTITIYSNGTFKVGGNTFNSSPGDEIIITDWFLIRNMGGTNGVVYRGYNNNNNLAAYNNMADTTVTISNNTVTVTNSNFTYSYTCLKKLVLWPADDFDYYKILNNVNNTTVGYFNKDSDIVTVGSLNNPVNVMFTQGKRFTIYNTGETINSSTWMYTGSTYYIDNSVYRISNLNVAPWVSINISSRTYSPEIIYYPRSVENTQNIGINYTESNRVNNYLMETEYIGGSTTITTKKLNLTPGMGLTDNTRAMGWGTIPKFWRANSQTYTYNGVNADVGLPTFTGTDFSNYTDNIRTYDVLDVLDYYNITLDQPITIKPYGTSNYTLNNGESIGDNNFSKLRNNTYGTPGFMDDKWYCIYYPDTGLFDFYDKNDVKMQTSNVCYVSFCGSNARYGAIVDYNYNIIGYYDFGTSRPTPYLEILYTTETGGTTIYHYADITKGYSIKNNNYQNVIWNNAYINGTIELLFRAENTQTIYHNDIIVGDNNISIDYSSNRFYVTLNSGDPVDIGTWRNIILNIDLTNGYLSVTPVRTFNSYTNVVLDNANIIIGNLINPVPTNIIEWQPTTNSLGFNIYSTSVFMNSYGVVMVDPTLDVTQYFTNLDNFYQLRLSDFSIYGQSMTINGVTGTVTGGTVTFNNETIQIKDMQITYADGNVTISDSYANIDLGAITDNTISMTGAWYFITELYSGYTTEKVIYDWDWSDFILDDKAFGVIYIGLCLIGLIVARKFFTMTITDYLLFIISIVIALTVPVIA